MANPAAGPVLNPGIAPGGARRSLRTYLLIIFLVVSILPIVLLAIAIATQNARHREEEARMRLREAAVAIKQDVDQYLEEHRRAIAVLVPLIEGAKPDTATRNAVLHRHHRHYPGFYTMLVADVAGTTVAADAWPTQTAGPVLDKKLSVADREYFRAARDTDRIYISDLFLGRGFGVDPIVAVSAPLHDASGRFAGIVEGSLNLRGFQRFEEQYQGMHRAEIIILDAHDKVVYASPGSGMKLLDVRTGMPMLRAAAAASDSAGFYFERTEAGGRNTEYLASQAPLVAAKWRVFVRQPVSALQEETQRYYLFTLFWAVAAIALSWILARAASRRITQPLHVLVTSLREFQIAGGEKKLAIEPSTVAEIAELVSGFEEMTGRLSRTLTGLLPICASCKKIRDDQGHWNQIETYIRDRSEAEFSHGLCPECLRRLYPEDYKPK